MKKSVLFLIVTLVCMASVALAAPTWTPVATANDVETFFVDSGIWTALLPPSDIPVAATAADKLSDEIIRNARSYISSTIPEDVTVAAGDEHLSLAGDLYVKDEFTVHLLTQDCDKENEVGYFTYAIDENGQLFIGEAGVIYRGVNKYSGPALGTGATVTLQQDYDGFVRVGFFIRSKRTFSYNYYEALPLSQTIFTVSEFNNIPGKLWYSEMGTPALESDPPARDEFSYIFDYETAAALFPNHAHPVMIGFEDDFWASSWVDGYPSDWDYNDVVIVTDPIFRSVETNNPVPGSISGLVWVDEDQDGIRDEDEKILDSVPVYLLDEQGNVIAETVTDVDGKYYFGGLEEGTYFVEFGTDENWTISPKDQGDDEAVDSDADVSTGRTDAIVLGEGENREHVDMGVFGAATDDICEMLGMATNFNALIFGDLTSSGGDTEGRLAVGGTATLNIAGYSVGYAVTGRPIPNLGNTADMLIVGGDLHDGYFGVNGNIVYGGTRYGPTRYDVEVRQVTPITFAADGNVMDDGNGYTFDYLRERMELRSQQYSFKMDRGVVGRENPDEWSFVLTGNDPELNIFNVTAEEFNGTSRGITISAPEGSTVLVNIVGEEINLQRASITLVGVDAEHVLYNFVDATSITLQSVDINGSVLALYADVSMSGASVNGIAVIGGNVNNVNGSEFHNFHFFGNVCVDDATVAAAPAMRMVLTQNTAANGRILIVESGSTVTNHYRVINTGISYLGNIQIEDDELGLIADVDTGMSPLAPGESMSFSVAVPNVAADKVYVAKAKAAPVGAHGESSVWNEIEEQDSATLNIGTPVDPNAPNPEWYSADFAIESIAFASDEPVLPGDVFSVTVTVVNNGTLGGDAGTLSFFLNAASPVEAGATADYSAAIGTLDPAGTFTYTFEGLVAGAAGTYHLRAFADTATSEWSKGDNQDTLVYTIEDLRPDFAVTAIRFADAEPTLTEQAFSVIVTIANRGDIIGDAGTLSVYVSQPTYASVGQAGDVEVSAGEIEAGDSIEIRVDGLTTPAIRATHHLRAFVDSEGLATEWSTGDNQLSIVYAASLPTFQAAPSVDAEHGAASLSWTGFDGDVYKVEATTNIAAEDGGFFTVAEGIVLGGSADNYITDGNVIYFFDTNDYSNGVIYRIVTLTEEPTLSSKQSVRAKL